MKTLRVAVQQAASLAGDVAGNLDRIAGDARRAADAGAALLVCPEMALTGYDIGAAAVQSLAEPVEGASADAVARIAQQTRVAIVYGYPERGAAGAVFNAAQCIGASGERLMNHRKSHLFGTLDRGLFAEAGDVSAVFSIGEWRVGVLICYEVEFPENTRRLALAGADLIAVPTANMRDFDFVATTLVPTRAYENQCYLAYANHCGREGDTVYGGLSSIVAPDGSALAVAGRDAALLFADLNRAALDASRARLPYLADRRPALY